MDWKTDLINYIDKAKSTKFCWDKHNCVTFIMDWILLTAKIDPMESFRKRFKTQRGAYRVMKSTLPEGSNEDVLEGAISRRMEICGFEEIKPVMAQNGDVMLSTDEEGNMCCSIMHAGKPWGLQPEGVVFADADNVHRAWRIPKGVV